MAVEEGQKAPAFTLEGDDGEVHELGDHEGARRPLLLFAWRNVKVGGHVDKVLEALEALG